MYSLYIQEHYFQLIIVNFMLLNIRTLIPTHQVSML